MKTIKMLVELKYDDKMMYGKDADAPEWFYNDILKSKKGLTLNSNEIGDDIGKIKVLKIVSK